MRGQGRLIRSDTPPFLIDRAVIALCFLDSLGEFKEICLFRVHSARGIFPAFKARGAELLETNEGRATHNRLNAWHLFFAEPLPASGSASSCTTHSCAPHAKMANESNVRSSRMRRDSFDARQTGRKRPVVFSRIEGQKVESCRAPKVTGTQRIQTRLLHPWCR